MNGGATNDPTVAAGEEVQHWIWLLRTFSDRCCVTHLNARLLYMVSLESLRCLEGNMHVMEEHALLYIVLQSVSKSMPEFCAKHTAKAWCFAASR